MVVSVQSNLNCKWRLKCKSIPLKALAFVILFPSWFIDAFCLTESLALKLFTTLFLFVFVPVYPTPLISVRFRESVFRETGHTIMNLLAVSMEAAAVLVVFSGHSEL